jgi:hypothetical protein
MKLSVGIIVTFFFIITSLSVHAKESKYKISTDKITAHVTQQGLSLKEINSKLTSPVLVSSGLEGCQVTGEAALKEIPGNGIECVRFFKSPENGASGVLTERFLHRKDYIHCEIEIKGNGKPWTTAIKTNIGYDAEQSSGFWTAWADPQPGKVISSYKEFYDCKLSFSENWSDPLQPQPFRDDTLFYGAPYFELYCKRRCGQSFPEIPLHGSISNGPFPW